jgi:hypothetical protein
MIHTQAALAHHFFEIPVRELVAAVPAHADEDDCGIEMTPLEGAYSDSRV